MLRSAAACAGTPGNTTPAAAALALPRHAEGSRLPNHSPTTAQPQPTLSTHHQSRPPRPLLSWRSRLHSCCCLRWHSSTPAGRRPAARALVGEVLGRTSSSPSRRTPARPSHRCLRRRAGGWQAAAWPGLGVLHAVPATCMPPRCVSSSLPQSKPEQRRARACRHPSAVVHRRRRSRAALTAALARPAQRIT